MQVGPLAQVLVGYAQGHEPIKRWTDQAAGDGVGGGGNEAAAGGAALDAGPARWRARCAPPCWPSWR